MTKMSSFTPAFCVLFAACVFAKNDPDKYAESPEHFNEQHLSHLKSQDGLFYVFERDYKLETEVQCQAAKKIADLGHGKFKVQLSAKKDGKFFSYVVEAEPIKTGLHQEPNGARYQEDPREGPLNHRIMTTNDKRTCFVITVPQGDQQSCFVLVKEDVVDQGVPQQCNDVYRKYCGPQSITLYNKKDCKQQ